MAIFGPNSAFLVSLAIYIKLEGHIMAKNDILDEADYLHPEIFLG